MAQHLSMKQINAKVRKNDLIGALVDYYFTDYYAYGVVSHISELLGPLVRLHSKTYPQRPEYFGEIIKDTNFLSLFHNVKKAVRYPEVAVLEFVDLSPDQVDYPRLRSGGARYIDQETGEMTNDPWVIIEPDGTFETVPSEHEDLPYLSGKSLHNIPTIEFIFDNNLTPERSFLIAMGKLVLPSESEDD